MGLEHVEEIGIVDEDLVSFFDLLARFDYEDRKKSGLLLAFETASSSPTGEAVSVASSTDLDENREQ